MANLINRTDVPLSLPLGGPVLRPGVSTKVKRWNVIKGAPVVKSWLAAKAIVVEELAEDHVHLAPVNATVEVDIPEDWADMGWNERRALAQSLSADPIRNGDEVTAVITAEIERRG